MSESRVASREVVLFCGWAVLALIVMEVALAGCVTTRTLTDGTVERVEVDTAAVAEAIQLAQVVMPAAADQLLAFWQAYRVAQMEDRAQAAAAAQARLQSLVEVVRALGDADLSK